MDFFKRIGTDRHKFKLQFFIGKVKVSKKLKGEVSIAIKRGDHKANSQKKLELDDQGMCDFEKQILNFDSLTLFYDQDDKKYQEKQGQIRIVFTTKKGDKKLLGAVAFDMAELANNKQQNYHFVKKMGDKIQVAFEYDVFIKYIGEASQVSKSTEKKIEKKNFDKKQQKREQKSNSSLSKFQSLFTSKDGRTSDQEHSDKKKRSKKKHHHDQQLSQEKNNTKNKKTDKSQAKNHQKQQKHKKYDKNYVLRDKMSTKSQRQEQHKSNKGKNAYLTQSHDTELSSPPIYFDQPQNKKTHKMNRTQKKPEYSSYSQNKNDQENSDSFFGSQKIDQNIKLKPFQIVPDAVKIRKQTHSPQGIDQRQKQYMMQQQLQELKEQLKKNKKQLQKSKTENKQLRQKLKSTIQENVQLNKDLSKSQKTKEQLQQQIKMYNNDLFETEREMEPRRSGSKINNSSNTKLIEQKLKSLQRQKGQLLVKLQQIKQKHKKELQKCQLNYAKLQEQNNQLKSNKNGEITKIKQNFTNNQDKYNKLLQKYQERSNQTKKAKKQAEQYKNKFAQAQSSLSALKIKIGQQLNHANQEADQSVISILTDLLD